MYVYQHNVECDLRDRDYQWSAIRAIFMAQKPHMNALILLLLAKVLDRTMAQRSRLNDVHPTNKDEDPTERCYSPACTTVGTRIKRCGHPELFKALRKVAVE